jgi:hypothetical protein
MHISKFDETPIFCKEYNLWEKIEHSNDCEDEYEDAYDKIKLERDELLVALDWLYNNCQMLKNGYNTLNLDKSMERSKKLIDHYSKEQLKRIR